MSAVVEDPLAIGHEQDAHLEAYSKLISQLHFYIVACFAVLVWDIMITLRLEIQYVWPSRFTLVKLCFFVNRYLTLVIMTLLVACSFSPTLTENCARFHLLQAYLPILVFLCCNYKLVQRASSLFHDPRPVFYSLVFVVLAQAVVQAGVSVKNQPVPMPPGMTGCYSFPRDADENYAFIYWLLPLITQTIVLVITLWKVLQYYLSHGRSHLLDIFLKDGVHFFAVTASSNIVNVVYMKSKVHIDGHALSGANFNSALALIINSMMVSRLIIHMRIALADHTTVTYHTDEAGSKLEQASGFTFLGYKIGLPKSGITRSSYVLKKRKDHHTQHGVTTIVDLSHLEKASNTFSPTPTVRSPTTRMNSFYKNERHSASSNASFEDSSTKGFEFSSASVPTIAFNLPDNHHTIISPPLVRIQGKVGKETELMRLNRRPFTAPDSLSTPDAPVLFVGEHYHHKDDASNAAMGGAGLRNAIVVTTEKIVKTEGGSE